MNLKVSVKYQLHEYKVPVVIFYTITLLICAVALAATMPAGGSDTVRVRFGGLEFATIIFLFFAGLNSFRDVFRLFMQNSISRKTLFTGRLICAVVTGCVMTLLDTVINIAGNVITSTVGSTLVYQSFFELVYGLADNDQTASFLFIAESLLFTLASYLAASMFGYFITVLYYRLNKGGKIAVSVSIPVFLFVALPLLDTYVINSTIRQGFSKFFLFAFGLSNGIRPWMGIVTIALTFVFFSGLSWLLVRKAAVKD